MSAAYTVCLPKDVNLIDKPVEMRPFFRALKASSSIRHRTSIESWKKDKEELMLDLAKFTDEFIQKELPSFDEENLADQAVLQAINATTEQMADREGQVRRWLHKYRVLRFIPPDIALKISTEIIEFADSRQQTRLGWNSVLVPSEFERLRDRISHVAGTAKSGKPRGVTSLTSKALWCCYPFDVPMFDGYAVSALRVISRLSGIRAEPNRSEYAGFVNVWFQVYDEIESAIELADLKDYPYKVRVLDRLLWHIGQPSFAIANDISISG